MMYVIFFFRSLLEIFKYQALHHGSLNPSLKTRKISLISRECRIKWCACQKQQVFTAEQWNINHKSILKNFRIFFKSKIMLFYLIKTLVLIWNNTANIVCYSSKHILFQIDLLNVRYWFLVRKRVLIRIKLVE